MTTRMKLLALFTLLGLFAALPALAARTQETKSLTQQGDDLYEQRGDLAKAKEALAKYQDALIQQEDPYSVYWRLARVEYWIGDNSNSKDEKIKLFGLGIYHAKKAVALEPNKVEGHYWLGVNDGSYGQVKGVLKSLSLVGPIKEEMNKVLAIDPAYDDGGADLVLGRMYFELPGLFGGSNQKSLEHLLKSRDLGPRVPLTRVYLADTYLALGDVAKARAELEFAVAMELDPKQPDMPKYQKMAADKLKDKRFAKT